MSYRWRRCCAGSMCWRVNGCRNCLKSKTRKSRCPKSKVQRPMSKVKQQMSKVQRPMSKVKHRRAKAKVQGVQGTSFSLRALQDTTWRLNSKLIAGDLTLDFGHWTLD